MCSPVFGNCPGCNTHNHSPYKEAAASGPPIRIEPCDDVTNYPGTIPFPHWTTDLKLYEVMPDGDLCARCDERLGKWAEKKRKEKGREETKEEAERRFRAERDRDNERRKKKRREKKASQAQNGA